MKEILTLFIFVANSFQVADDTQTVNMVGFTGHAEGPYFTGRILPGGVDTQRYTAEGGSLSARYMLEGMDSMGDSCRVFIENSVTPGMPQGHTHPTLVTNSKALQQMTKGELTGRLTIQGDTIVIRIGRSEEHRHE